MSDRFASFNTYQRVGQLMYGGRFLPLPTVECFLNRSRTADNNKGYCTWTWFSGRRCIHISLSDNLESFSRRNLVTTFAQGFPLLSMSHKHGYLDRWVQLYCRRSIDEERDGLEKYTHSAIICFPGVVGYNCVNPLDSDPLGHLHHADERR